MTWVLPSHIQRDTSGRTTPRRCPARGSYAASSSRLPKGVYEIPLRQINDKKAYGMDVDVGTSPQKVTLLVDTGSNTYSVQPSYDICCQEAMCKDTGTLFVDNSVSNVVSD
ncbi:Peptidase aspartic, catalytic [Akanthomyces lecanii RCEF 1005]|uniref:Peptidase aspartic, catalytic n=1 Tax=Akanthomyces lecanii RCEF 1005 TaxID=1081108 RepID=A0A162JJN3_CORDF|nr:Peptidase aspartic, catalytic [Akanthomyces lecanii RCEF 1005]